MPNPLVTDTDRTAIALGQIKRMSASSRTQLLKSIGAEPSDPSVANDPADMSTPSVNVKDKGMTPSPPAPQGETPRSESDPDNKVTPEQNPTVVDKGLQTPLQPNDGQVAQGSRVRRRRPASQARRVQAAQESKFWKSIELAKAKVAAGLIDPSREVNEAQEIARTKSLEVINAQIEAFNERTQATASVRRPMVPHAAEGGQMVRPVVTAGRTI